MVMSNAPALNWLVSCAACNTRKSGWLTGRQPPLAARFSRISSESAR